MAQEDLLSLVSMFYSVLVHLRASAIHRLIMLSVNGIAMDILVAVVYCGRIGTLRLGLIIFVDVLANQEQYAQT